MLPPVLVLATPEDRLVPIRGVRATGGPVRRPVVEFPGMGHDLMLDARWREPLTVLLGWLATTPWRTDERRRDVNGTNRPRCAADDLA